MDSGTLEFFARSVEVVATIEDHVLHNGFGCAVMEHLHSQQINTAVARVGWPDEVIEDGGVGRAAGRGRGEILVGGGAFKKKKEESARKFLIYLVKEQSSPVRHLRSIPPSQLSVVHVISLSYVFTLLSAGATIVARS